MNEKELQKSKKEILSKISTANKIAVFVSDPDGDAAASGLALEEVLEQLGKKAKLYSSFKMDEYSFLPRFDKYEITDIGKLDFDKFDLIIVLDSSDLSRIVDTKKYPEGIKTPKKSFLINIDHHRSNTFFGNINYVPLETPISSATEAVYDIFKSKIHLTKSLATNFLTGIITDTGCFKHPNTTSKTLKTASELLKSGADKKFIIHHIYYSYPEKIIRLNIKSLNTLKVKKAGKYKYAYTILPINEFNMSDYHREQVVIVKETIRAIDSIDLSILITKLSSSRTKLSFRSRTVEIVKIAEFLGGGGHAEAAGATVNLTIDETLSKVDSYLKRAELERVI